MILLGFFVLILFSACGRKVDVATTTTTVASTTTTSSTTTTTIAQVATPTFLLPAGTHEANSLLITIECQTAGAEIYYTNDGTTPDATATLYTTPFTLETSSLIKAVAFKAGQVTSEVASADYSLYWWQALGAGTNGSPNTIYDLKVDSNDNLYICGYFNQAGGLAADCFAKWDGQTWEANTQGLPHGQGYKLAIDASNNVYLARNYSSFPPDSRGIYRWDGTSWNLSSVVSHPNYNGATIGEIKITGIDKYFLAGQFTTAGSISATNIAYYNGVTFESLLAAADSGLSSLVLGENDDLYVAGYFTAIGSVSAKRLAKWDGGSWEALGSGLNHDAYSIVWDGLNNYYVGGQFTQAGGISANRIAQWDGQNYLPLGDGFSNSVQDIAIASDGTLYAAGSFISAEGNTVNYIARWDGNNWSALGNGLDNAANALALDSQGNLYVGGNFTEASGVTANRIAKWGLK